MSILVYREVKCDVIRMTRRIASPVPLTESCSFDRCWETAVTAAGCATDAILLETANYRVLAIPVATAALVTAIQHPYSCWQPHRWWHLQPPSAWWLHHLWQLQPHLHGGNYITVGSCNPLSMVATASLVITATLPPRTRPKRHLLSMHG